MYVAYKLYQQAGCEQFHKSMQPSAMSQARATALDCYRKHQSYDIPAGPVPLVSHQHQNGNQAPRSEPAQGKRGAGVVSSTAQEAKEDLLAGDLELLSGHLEKAKRCHIHVTSTDTSTSAAPAQSRPAAAQQARPAPESPTVSQQQAAPAMAPQTRQPHTNSQRYALLLHLLGLSLRFIQLPHCLQAFCMKSTEVQCPLQHCGAH